MASPSSSPSSVKYDVFLSFRGADTRDSFTSHLHSALCRQGIITFIDDRLDRGDVIEPTILKAIEDSIISVIIFSKNYANSTWCLDELVKSIKCMKANGQKVLPIFYDIDPADVENQTGSYGVAFAKHEEDFAHNIDKVLEWRAVLTETSYLSGWDSRKTKPESALVEEIVKDILKKLSYISLNDFDDLVGIQSQVEQIESLLLIGSTQVRVIGLWGMGGIGKTTLARVIFERNSSYFDGSCFLENVREETVKRGLAKLQNELLANVLNEGHMSMGISNSRPIFLRKQLCRKRVLIVLDDVDNYEQLEKLARKHDWFGAGSRIIITSRDKQVFQDRVDAIYEVQALGADYAIQLFSLCAFKENERKKDLTELSDQFVSYARGIPLALKILGLFLYGKSEEEWQSALYRLEKSPDMHIQKVLRISYDGLEYYEQQVFLDIACFFKGELTFYVKRLLEMRGFPSSICLRVLADKSLIFMSNNKIEMHDLLQEMGRDIIRQESIKEPGKRSRLWNHNDISHVLTNNTGTEAVEVLFLDQSKISGLLLPPTAFGKMNQIKMLKLYTHSYEHDVCLPQGLAALPNGLRYLQWDYYPLKSLPSNFLAGSLVELNMFESNVERLWAGAQDLVNLRVINLCDCRNLMELPDFSMASNLTTINCKGCVNLQEVSQSIESLDNLVDLNLRNCKKIRSVPSTRSVQGLDLFGCSNLQKLPEVARNIDFLELGKTKFEKGFSKVASHSELGNQQSDISRMKCFVKMKTTTTIIYIVDFVFAWGEDEFMSASACGDDYFCYDGLSLINNSKAESNGFEDCWSFFQRIKCYGTALLGLGEGFPRINNLGEYMSTGSSITISLPQNWFRTNFLGFSLCALLEFEDNSMRDIIGYLHIRWKCKFLGKSGGSLSISVRHAYWPDSMADDSRSFVTYNSSPEHVSDSWFNESECYEASFEAHLENSCYKVVYCKIQLMYIGDEEGSNTMIQPRFSFDPSQRFSKLSLIKGEKDSETTSNAISSDMGEKELQGEDRLCDDNADSNDFDSTKILVDVEEEQDDFLAPLEEALPQSADASIITGIDTLKASSSPIPPPESSEVPLMGIQCPTPFQETKPTTLPHPASSTSVISSQGNPTKGTSSKPGLKDRLSRLRSLQCGHSSSSSAEIKMARAFLSSLLKFSLVEAMEMKVLKEAMNSLQVLMSPAASNVGLEASASEIFNHLSQLASTYEACQKEQNSIEVAVDERETLEVEERNLESDLSVSHDLISSTRTQIDNEISKIKELEKALETARSNLAKLEQELLSAEEQASSKLDKLNQTKSSLAEVSKLEDFMDSRLDELEKENERMLEDWDLMKKLITHL